MTYFLCTFIHRVLHRLAEKELLNGTKLTKEKWELLIRKLIENGEDDFSVYSLLRKYYIGKSLEDSLRINIVSINDNEDDNNSNNHNDYDNNSNNHNDYNNNSDNNCVLKDKNHENKIIAPTALEVEVEEDGRANFMADMTIECIPQTIGAKSRTDFLYLQKKNIFFLLLLIF